MDDKHKDHSKPLRSSSNKVKDLFNTYVKHDKDRTVPITDSESEKMQKEETDMETQEIKNEETMKKEDEDTKIQEMNDIMSEELEEKEKQLNEAQNQINELKKEKDELKEQVKRKAAELENFRQRTIREKNEMVDYANERLLFKMLEVLDDINLAIEAGQKSENSEALLRGFEMIRQKYMKIFEESGVKKMEDPVGKPFDVDYQEAMMTAPSDMPENHVVQVIQPGYMIHDRVLRYARVITSSGEAPEENE
jgi:molecular chaperone GrpE